MEEFKEIIQQIKKVPIVMPSDVFTDRTMSRVNLIEENPLSVMQRKIFLSIRSIFHTPPTKEDCAVSFISLGFFYFIMALILFFYINGIPGNSGIYDWLRFQPKIFILVALWLAAIGAAIWIMGRSAVKFARWGAIIYILIFIISGVVMSAGGKFELLLGSALSLGALFTGLSLEASIEKLAYQSNINKCEQRTNL